MTNFEELLRPNIRSMKPYSSARHDFMGQASVWLDANENPYGGGINRYPDPRHTLLKDHLARIWSIPTESIFLGNGSDEAIDLLIRAFCRPGLDRIVTMPPTYGMYEVCAAINGTEVQQIPLTTQFDINTAETHDSLASFNNKIYFLCSPNNPNGGLLSEDRISHIAENSHGLVVLDQAYADFSTADQTRPGYWLNKYDNIICLRTFSKAWGLAGIRVGIAIGNPKVIDILHRIKPPYNINSLSQEAALSALDNMALLNKRTAMIIEERNRIIDVLVRLNGIHHIYPTEANFILVRFNDAEMVYRELLDRGIVVRNRTSAVPGTLRITVGTPKENNALISALKEIL